MGEFSEISHIEISHVTGQSSPADISTKEIKLDASFHLVRDVLLLTLDGYFSPPLAGGANFRPWLHVIYHVSNLQFVLEPTHTYLDMLGGSLREDLRRPRQAPLKNIKMIMTLLHLFIFCCEGKNPFIRHALHIIAGQCEITNAVLRLKIGLSASGGCFRYLLTMALSFFEF